MARTRNHGRNADDTPTASDADSSAGDGEATAIDLPAADDTPSGCPRWLVSIPGCHPEDRVVEAPDGPAAVEAYKAQLGIRQLPVAAVVTPAPPADADGLAPAPE